MNKETKKERWNKRQKWRGEDGMIEKQRRTSERNEGHISKKGKKK
jgi:hypothetical protein